MAKTRQRSFETLPLSGAFYAQITHTAKRQGFALGNTESLAEAVSVLSRAYTRERSQLSQTASGAEAHFARLGFFLARDLVKVFGPLDELARQRRLPSPASLRVLDVGAGLGATSLGLSRWLKLRGLPVQRLEVTALERDRRALATFRELTSSLEQEPLRDEFVPISLDAREVDLAHESLEGSFDLVLFGFVLNELASREPVTTRIANQAELLLQAASRLRDGGAVIVLEPALKETSRELMHVRNVIAARHKAPFVLAPCIRTGPCPMLEAERDWCHSELAYALPPKLAEVAQAAGLRYEGLSYAALLLANAPRELPAIAPDERLYRIVSERLESKGKLELYGCGETGYRRLTRLERDHSADNAAFGEAERGAVLRLHEAVERVQKTTRVERA